MPPVTRKAKSSLSIPKTRSSTAGSQNPTTFFPPSTSTSTRDAAPPSQSTHNAAPPPFADSLFGGAPTTTTTTTSHLPLLPPPSAPLPSYPLADADPVHQIAARLGSEVEYFANTVDMFVDNLTDSRADRFTAACQLVDDFRARARQSVADLERSCKLDLASRLRAEWRRDAKFLGTATMESEGRMGGRGGGVGRNGEEEPVFSARQAEQIEILRQRREEVDLWDLFKIVLEEHYHPDPEGQKREREEAVAAKPKFTRYTEEAELWEGLWLVDDQAREHALVKAWLERVADHQLSPLAGIAEELEAKAGRGKGLWSHGWMHTREKIKGEKRLKSWSASADAPLPQIKRSDNSELLVASLDPDAVSRQERTLEKPDAYSERAIWIACWEMLRRGLSWEEVSQWCEERKEGWRAVSIGKSADLSHDGTGRTWRKMCRLASQSGSSNEYEVAVYGLLGGNYESVKKVCRTVHDHLFAAYSSSLIQRLDHYLASRFPDGKNATRREGLFDAPEDSQRIIRDLIGKLRTEPITTTEATQPMRILESYCLMNDLDQLILALGHAVSFEKAQSQANKGLFHSLDKYWDGNENLPEAEIILQGQSLRIIANVAVILNVLRPGQFEAEGTRAEENLFVAYIQALRAAGKRQEITPYATRLSEGTWTMVMSRVMQDITDRDERDTTIALMHQHDVVAVLSESLKFCLTNCLGENVPTDRPLRMLEPTDDKILYPGQRIIAGFLPDRTTEPDDAIIRSLQWYNFLAGHWKETFSALAKALRQCLVAGHIACAINIVREFPFDKISHQKSMSIIGKSVNIMDYDGRAPADKRQTWDAMVKQSKTYWELGHLVKAIEALSRWRDLEYELTSKRHISPPSELKKAKNAVDEAMQQILSGILRSPVDGEEEADLAVIRKSYIPEVIIAYNTVLHSAGSIITRHALVESMDLSITVANDDNKLSECFVQSGRMRELVTSFACTSKAMLILKAEGGKWVPKKEREGKDLGIWEIGPQGSRGVGDHEVAPISFD